MIDFENRGPRPPFTWTLISTLSDTTNLTTYTFSSVVIPRAGLVVVAVNGSHGSLNRTFDSGTIDGVAADLVIKVVSSRPVQAGIIQRVVSAGTMDITATFSAAVARCQISIFLLENYSSSTAHFSLANNTTSNPIPLIDFEIPAKGVGIFAANINENVTASWSSATSQVNEPVESNRMTSAIKESAAGETNTEEVTFGSSSIRKAMAGASWS